MFDLAWSEIALIAVVAVVVIGPKDLPDAVRGVAKGIQKLRRMAGEFQGHLDEVVREAKLEDVRDQIRDIRNFDLKSTIEKAVDEDGSITKAFRDDPFRAPPPPTSDAAPSAGTAATEPVGAPPVDATAPDVLAAAPPAADAAGLDTPVAADLTPAPFPVAADMPAAPAPTAEAAPVAGPATPAEASPTTAPAGPAPDTIDPAVVPPRPAIHTA
ncbi:Sec-independent protein translocase protein TatB [Muricoccus radiodurans]|uniref:Sec-independent protein translocase protein TatB n=1 Tax=Muricoccus radiodurans TaxID=2231721 RepID=UPI003CED1A43